MRPNRGEPQRGHSGEGMLEHVPGVRPERRLPQPSKQGHVAVLPANEQLIQPSTMSFRQPLGQLLIDATIGPRDRFRADALNCIQSRQQMRRSRSISTSRVASTMPLSVCMAVSIG